MKKDVKIKITGVQIPVSMMTEDGYIPDETELQAMEENTDVIELETTGIYYSKDDINYLKYDEIYEGLEKPVKNLLKFDENKAVLSKKGAVNTVLEFSDNSQFSSKYQTPYGPILIGVSTECYDMNVGENSGQISIRYYLDYNYDYLVRCTLDVDFKTVDN